MKNRRKHERTPAEETIISAVIRPVSGEKEIWCMVVDLSKRGVQVTTPLRMVPGTEVALTITLQEEKDASLLTRQHDHRGLIRWCNQDPAMSETYNIGIEFLPLNTEA